MITLAEVVIPINGLLSGQSHTSIQESQKVITVTV